MTDFVFIEDLRVDAIIGIYDWEKKIRQTLSFDVEMSCDNTLPAGSGKIQDTIDYKDVAKQLKLVVEEKPHELVETLAEDIATMILEQFKVPWLRLKLHKLGAVTGSRAVGVSITRGNFPAQK